MTKVTCEHIGKFPDDNICRDSGVELPTKNGWIKCYDKIPENKSIVLVWNGEEIAVCKLYKSELEYFFVLLNTQRPFSKVSHWQPLPEAPE